MVGLYRDPEGETVFTAHEEALQVTAALRAAPQANLQAGDEIQSSQASLAKKVQHLEKIIAEYKVSI